MYIRRYSFAAGSNGNAADALSAVFALSGGSCRSKGVGTARFCAAELCVSAPACFLLPLCSLLSLVFIGAHRRCSTSYGPTAFIGSPAYHRRLLNVRHLIASDVAVARCVGPLMSRRYVNDMPVAATSIAALVVACAALLGVVCLLALQLHTRHLMRHTGSGPADGSRGLTSPLYAP